MDHILNVKSITHSFGNKMIFANTGIECKTGEIAGIFGRNGTGKSTLFKILFGTLKADKKEIYFDDQLFAPELQVSPFIGYHTQEIMLPQNVHVENIISMYVHDQNKRDKIYYAQGVGDFKNKKIRHLSLGQKRYFQFLLLLSLNHNFILLDEPFAMIEPIYKDLIKKMIVEYKSFKGFLIADHYYIDVLEIANKLSLIKDGKIIPIVNNEDLIRLGYLTNQSFI
jgi:ABC-type multidrug transport system ATPase subunit